MEFTRVGFDRAKLEFEALGGRFTVVLGDFYAFIKAISFSPFLKLIVVMGM